MPRNITVTFDDGSSHVYQNAPDDVTPEQVSARASKEYGKGVVKLDGGKSESKGFLESAGDFVKNVGTGFVKGVTGLATAAGDVMANDPQIREATIAAAKKRGVAPETIAPKFGELSDKVATLGYQPTTKKEAIIQALAAGAGGGLTGPGAFTSPVRAALVGTSAGAGAQVGNEVSNGNPVATIVGGLLGGGTAGVLSGLKGNTQALAGEALRDVKPADLITAQARQAEAAAAGTPINLSQAMPNPSNLDTMVNTLANSRYGQKVTKQLRDQPSQVAMGVETELGKLPGDVRAPQVVANNMQSAATEVIGGAKKARGQAWLDEYNKGVLDLKAKAMGQTETTSRPSTILDESGAPIMAQTTHDAVDMVGKLPTDTVKSAYDKLGAMAAQRPNTGLSNMLEDLRSRLKKGDEFITDGEQLNGVLKDVTAKLKSPDLASKGVDAGGVKFLSNAINDVRADFGEKFAPFRDANTRFAQITEDVVNPLKKSVVGDVAGRRGALPDAEAVKSRVNGIFDAGTVPGAKSSEILNLEKSIRDIPDSATSVSGPAAFQDAAKSWMASKISSAAKTVGGRTDDNIAAHLESTFMGTDTKAQGFKDVLVGLARSEKLPDNTYVEGMQKFFKIASAAARRPSSVQGVSSAGAAEIAGKTLANAGGQTTVNPFRNIMMRWSERLQADAYREMDNLLTSPEGVDMLRKLAKQPAMSPAAQNTISTYLGTQAVVNDKPDPVSNDNP